MTGDDRFREDEVLTKLGGALGYDPPRQPPPERVAALRAAAERMRQQQHQQQSPPPHQPPSGATGADVVPMPRRRGFLLGGAAASVAALAGFTVRGLLGDGEDVATEPITFASTLPQVRTDAALINHTWGTELMVDISGLPAGETYQVAYTGPAGKTGAGSFLSVAGTVMKCRFNAAVLRRDVAAVTIADATGAPLLRADLA